MKQITTQHVREWDSDGYKWEQGADGVWMCVELEEMTDRHGVREVPVDRLALVDEEESMRYQAPKPSGQRYPGGPVKGPV